MQKPDDSTAPPRADAPGEPDESLPLTRRNLLRSAAATDGALLGSALSPPASAAGYQGGEGSMMFMPGHSMIGAHTEALGTPADHDVRRDMNNGVYRGGFMKAEK